MTARLILALLLIPAVVHAQVLRDSGRLPQREMLVETHGRRVTPGVMEPAGGVRSVAPGAEVFRVVRKRWRT